MADRFRRKPTEIAAVRWDGSNVEEVLRFAPLRAILSDPFHPSINLLAGPNGESGLVHLPVGSWVATDGEGDFWPISEDTFERTYEAVHGG